MKTKQHRWWRKKTFQNKRQKVQQTLLSRQNKLSFQTVEFEKGLNSFWVSIFLICATYMSTSDTDSCDLIFVFIVTHDCCCVLILFCVFSFRAWNFFSLLYSVDTWNTFCLISGVDGRFSTKLKCNWELKLVVGILWWNHHSTVKLSEVLTDN